MAYRFDKKAILKRMHFKKPQKKSFTRSMFAFYRDAFLKIQSLFTRSFRLLSIVMIRHKIAFAGAMTLLVATSVVLYQPRPSGEEGFAHEEIIIIPSDDEDSFISFDDDKKMENSEVVNHLKEGVSGGDAPIFHSSPVVPGPELLASKPEENSGETSSATGPKNKGAELIGIIETDDTGFQPARISTKNSGGTAVQ